MQLNYLLLTPLNNYHQFIFSNFLHFHQWDYQISQPHQWPEKCFNSSYNFLQKSLYSLYREIIPANHTMVHLKNKIFMISQIFLILTCSCPWFFSYHHNSCSLTLILTTRDNPTADIMCQLKWWETSVQHDSMRRSVCPLPEKQLCILTKLSKITTFKFYFIF